MHRVDWYLNRVLTGMPVSRKTFLKQMEKAGYSSRYVLGVFGFGSKDTGIVEIKKPASLKQLIEQHTTSDNSSSRINAAIVGIVMTLGWMAR